MKRILVDGREGAGLPADDPGFTRGLNAFETLRTYGRAPFRLDAHLARLSRSVEVMGLPAHPEATIRAEIESLIADDVWIRVTLTAGGRRVVHAESVDTDRIGRPVRVAAVMMPPTRWLPGSVKHGCRAAWMLAARAHGVEEVLLMSADGRLLESNRSNVFVVTDGVIRTPPCDAGEQLEGITRGAVLEAAERAGLPVRVEAVRLEDRIDECHVSSTLKELAPISHIDGRAIGGGPIGARLHEALRALIAEECRGAPG